MCEFGNRKIIFLSTFEYHLRCIKFEFEFCWKILLTYQIIRLREKQKLSKYVAALDPNFNRKSIIEFRIVSKAEASCKFDQSTTGEIYYTY